MSQDLGGRLWEDCATGLSLSLAYAQLIIPFLKYSGLLTHICVEHYPLFKFIKKALVPGGNNTNWLSLWETVWDSK